MKPVFLMVDPFLRGVVGHSYDCDLRLVQAAEQAGYAVRLGVHKALAAHAERTRVMEPVYRLANWELRPPWRSCVPDILPRLADRLRVGRWLDRLDERLRFAHHVRTFVEDTQAWLGNEWLDERTIVFFPNADVKDLMGVEAFVRGRRDAAHWQWHFNLRAEVMIGLTDIPRDTPATYARMYRRLSEGGVRGQVHYWTDSRELSRDYARMGLKETGVLPIPYDPESLRAGVSVDASTLIVSYLGRAQGEKGFGELPQLIESFYSCAGDAHAVRFAVQVSLGRPSPEAERLRPAAEALRDRAEGGGVEVFGDLSSEAYAQRFHSTSIMLMPYDRAAYAAKSSGILAECLCAGIPFLAPEGTWMARQIQPAVYDWLAGLSRQAPVCETVPWPPRDVTRAVRKFLVHAYREDPPEREVSGLEDAFRWPEDGRVLEVAFPPVTCSGGGVLLLEAVFLFGDRPPIVRRHWLCDTEGPAPRGLLFAPEGVRSVRLFCSQPIEADSMRPDAAHVRVLGPGDWLDQPRSVIGGLYADAADQAEVLGEIVRHYAHYRATARQASDAAASWYNAPCLIRMLMESSAGPS